MSSQLVVGDCPSYFNITWLTSCITCVSIIHTSSLRVPN